MFFSPNVPKVHVESFLNSLCAQVEDVSAKKKEPEVSFHNKTSEQIKPNKKEKPVAPEEALYDMENVERGIARQPSSIKNCNSKSTTQTVSGYTEGSQQSSEQLRSLGEEFELVQLSSIASPNSLHSVTDTAQIFWTRVNCFPYWVSKLSQLRLPRFPLRLSIHLPPTHPWIIWM